MIIICDDCPSDDGYDFAKVWRYPCPECAQEFVDEHRATGHNVRTRSERLSDRYADVSL